MLLFFALTAAAIVGPSAANPVLERIRASMLVTYVEGISAVEADTIIGSQAEVEALQALLADTTFPRPDNVVSFLGFVPANASASTVLALVAFLERQTGEPSTQALRRARTLVPQALGWMARSGSEAAMTTLLSFSSSAPLNIIFTSALDRLQLPTHWVERIAEAAVWALALPRHQACRTRLQDLRDISKSPVRSKSMEAVAQRAEALWLGLQNGSIPVGSGVARGILPSRRERRADDTNKVSHSLTFGHCNHVFAPSVSNPLATALTERATSRLTASDFPGDVACCVEIRSAGSQGAFGKVDDGLDVINTQQELIEVLDHSCGRLKIVNQINYCGGVAPNILGCAYTAGNGIAVVRMDSLDREAILWLHELGHNTGIGHNSISQRYVMYAALSTSITDNVGVTQEECDQVISCLSCLCLS